MSGLASVNQRLASSIHGDPAVDRLSRLFRQPARYGAPFNVVFWKIPFVRID